MLSVLIFPRYWLSNRLYSLVYAILFRQRDYDIGDNYFDFLFLLINKCGLFLGENGSIVQFFCLLSSNPNFLISLVYDWSAISSNKENCVLCFNFLSYLLGLCNRYFETRFGS